jgi:hypothetical protein
MTDASDLRSVSTTTCPNCGAVQPQARRCQDCGATLPWSRPMLRGRERALATAGRGRARARWPAWVAGASVVLLVGTLSAVYSGLYPLSEPSTAALAAEAAGADPGLQRLLSEDPNALAQVRTVLDEARELGLSRQESLFRVQALLRELQAARDHVQAAAAHASQNPDQTTALTPNPIADSGAETNIANAVPLGVVGAAAGVERPPTRKCFGTGEDMECIEQFDDPAALSGGTGAAAALKNAETLRRKAKESADILKGL